VKICFPFDMLMHACVCVASCLILPTFSVSSDVPQSKGASVVNQ